MLLKIPGFKKGRAGTEDHVSGAGDNLKSNYDEICAEPDFLENILYKFHLKWHS